MTEFLFLIVIIQIVWLFALQDKLAGLRFRVQKLEQKKTQPTEIITPVKKTPELKPEEPLPSPAKPADAPAQQAAGGEPVSFVKLFSWIGGFLLLLGIIFAAKYAIALISPQMRVALSFALGVLLWTAGISLKKENIKTTAHTLAASGLAICYASCLTAYHFYHMLTPSYAVTVLACISITAFITAVWKNAQFICVLAQIGGFLTPFLVSVSAPDWTLFLTYILFIALMASAAGLKRAWNGQLVLCAVFTGICQLVAVEQAGTDIPVLHTVMAFSFVFGALFAAVSAIRKNGVCFLISTAACMLVICNLPHAKMLPAGFWGWFAAAFVFFAGIPFALKRRLEDDKPAWAAVCVAGLAALHLYFAIDALYNLPKGTVPLFFAAVYTLLTERAARWKTQNASARAFRLACLGGTAAFFLTMFVVCQFRKEWQTIAFALEGCALIWLNRRFAHPGLTWLGRALLSTACVRLTLNPCIGGYHPNAPKVFNWFLYGYGLSAAAMFLGARGWLPREQKTSVSFLNALGGITLFALVNVEIANWFSTNGHLNWNMFGNVTVAAAFTVAWALCGAVCLAGALYRGGIILRRAGIGLICVALAKLFLSDVWHLSAGARIVVLISVAAVLILISFAYQRMHKSNTL